MLVQGVDNRFIESNSPHSIGLKNNVTVPSPGFDQNPLIRNQKKFWGGNAALGTLEDWQTFFDLRTWDQQDWLIAGIATFMIYSVLHSGAHLGRRAHSAYTSLRR